jgi:hypothetical protein
METTAKTKAVISYASEPIAAKAGVEVSSGA